MYRFRDTLPIDISEKTISGDLVTIANTEEMGVVDSLEVSLEPIQDLHGYDKPWVGGAGKNKLPATVENIKASNTDITWNGNAGTKSGVTFTLEADSIGNLKDIKLNGTATVNIQFFIAKGISLTGNYILSGGKSASLSVAVGGKGESLGGDKSYTDDGTSRNSWIYVAKGTACNNITIQPMIRLASVSDATYEPYENICPISGRTEVVTHRTGKNLFDASDIVNGTISTSNGQNANADGSKRTDNYIPIKGGQQYILSGLGGAVRLHQYKADKSYIGNLLVNNGAYAPQAECANIRIAGNATWVTDNLMIRLASDTDASYEPYQGNTYTTALGRTVYGGTLDVVSGVLTVDRVMETFDGSNDEGWTVRQDGFRITFTPMGTQRFASGLCNAMPTKADDSSSAGILFGSNNNIIYLFGAMGWFGVTDVASFRTYLASNPLQVVYPLAKPQTYQLTPQQIDLLLGTNHLWSDGEISVVWHKDLTKGRILPTEAVSINGQYIENVLDGYRTLYTKGRESLGVELNTYSVGTADGEKFKSKRYPARELTVGFQLIGDNAEDFREKFNNLNNLLAIEEADFIFNDETDKFFSGYPIMNAEVEAGENSVKGEWKIYCAYPFKRSVDPITLTMADATVTNTTATFIIDYKGARPSRPVLRAKFAGAKSGGTSSEDGDCGFVAFMDGEENIVQLGNPDVLDLDTYAKAGTLINKEFVNVSDWTRTGGHTYKGTVTGTVSTSNTVDAFWDGGKGQTQSYAKPSYGSGTGLHGSILWKNTTGAVNFTLNAVHRLCVNNSNETGVFEVGAYNHSTGKMVAGFVIDKSGNGTTGVVRYIVNSKQVGTDQIDLSYYNNHFGYCNRTPVYVQQTYYDPVQQTYKVQVKTKKKKKKKKYVTKSRTVWVARTRTVQDGWNYTQSNLNSSVQKDGSYVYIQVGNLPMRTFNVPDVEQMIAHDASVYMGTYGTAMNTNMIHSLLFRRETGAVFAEQPNVFTAGDIVEADCNEATVYIYRDGSIGGHLEPQYGALGNDWEDFLLTSGTNVIRATWSDWVNPTYKPQIEIEYNEVFI